MHTTDERLYLLKQRVKRRSRIVESRWLGALAACSAALSIALVAVFVTVSGGAGTGTAPGLYGAMLRFDDAGGYVLVGVITFVLGAAVTGFCLWKKHKNETNKKFEEEDETC